MTNQVAVSQVSDWSICGLLNSLTAIFFQNRGKTTQYL